MIDDGGNYVPWTAGEDAILRPYVGGKTDIKTLQDLLPGRSYKAIERRIWRLKHPCREKQAKQRKRREVGRQREARLAALLRDVLAFIERYGLAKSQFGSMALHSPGFVTSLERGRNCTEDTERRVREFMAAGDPRPASAFKPQAYAQAKARHIRAEIEANHFREADPVEQAKRVIRAQRFACFEAEITRPAEHGKFFIGSRLVTKAELFAFARRHGWEG